MAPTNGIDDTHLRGALTCLLSGGSMTKVRLHKMLYLVERESILRHGRLAVGIPFLHHTHGMYSPMLASRLDALVAEGFLVANPVPSDSGQGLAYRLSPSGVTPPPVEIEEICRPVLEKYGRHTLGGLVAAAKATEPFVDTPQGAHVDWREFAANVRFSDSELSAEVGSELVLAATRARSGKSRVLTRAEALRALAPG